MATFMTGARPSPRHRLLSAIPHRAVYAPPPQSAFVPKQLSVWKNDVYGDCVTAEEAFAKACYSPEIFIPDLVVVDWASRHGFLNGADLTSVMDAMQQDGFVIGPQKYDDGHPSGVDWTNETTLQSAISQGPVKVSIDASALPSGAGNEQGWYAIGGGRNRNQDHCTSICGYGPPAWLYQQLNVPMPSVNFPPLCYLHFTWGTIGVVDHAWIQSTVGEAWLRNPTTVGQPPLTPPPPPTPSPIDNTP
jgi:hypothetical protein